MNTHFFYRYFRWFDLAYALSHRLFEALLVNDWLKVDLVDDVYAFSPALRRYNLNPFFLAQI